MICLQGDSLRAGFEQEGPRPEVLLHGLLHSLLSKNEIQGKYGGNISVHCGLLCLRFQVSFHLFMVITLRFKLVTYSPCQYISSKMRMAYCGLHNYTK